MVLQILVLNQIQFTITNILFFLVLIMNYNTLFSIIHQVKTLWELVLRVKWNKMSVTERTRKMPPVIWLLNDDTPISAENDALSLNKNQET